MGYEEEIDGVINDLREVFDARMAFIEDDDDFEEMEDGVLRKFPRMEPFNSTSNN